jgi:hypothetical protein
MIRAQEKPPSMGRFREPRREGGNKDIDGAAGNCQRLTGRIVDREEDRNAKETDEDKDGDKEASLPCFGCRKALLKDQRPDEQHTSMTYDCRVHGD